MRSELDNHWFGALDYLRLMPPFVKSWSHRQSDRLLFGLFKDWLLLFYVKSQEKAGECQIRAAESRQSVSVPGRGGAGCRDLGKSFNTPPDIFKFQTCSLQPTQLSGDRRLTQRSSSMHHHSPTPGNTLWCMESVELPFIHYTLA